MLNVQSATGLFHNQYMMSGFHYKAVCRAQPLAVFVRVRPSVGPTCHMFYITGPREERDEGGEAYESSISTCCSDTYGNTHGNCNRGLWVNFPDIYSM